MSIVVSVLLVLGGSFILLAGVGLVKMPTFFMRMQAASKASTLGCLFVLAGVSVSLGTWEAVIKSSIILLFLLLTTPIATHALAEAARAEKYDR